MTSRMRPAATNLCAALAAALCVGMATSASAAIESATGASAAPIPVEELEVLAEIRVRGKRLARSIEDAEDDFFKLYNQLNKDEQYDVACGHMRVDGSLIMQRACVPGFIANNLPPVTMGWPSTGTVCGFNAVPSFRMDASYDATTSYSCTFLPPSAPVVVGPSMVAVAMHKRDAYLGNVLKVINSDQRLIAKVRNIDSLYSEMLLMQNRFITVRTTAPPERVDPRQRPR